MSDIKNNEPYFDSPSPHAPPRRLAIAAESRLLLDVGSMALSFTEAIFQATIKMHQRHLNCQ